MNKKIGFMRWLGTKELGNWPPAAAQWPEEALFWEMLLSGTIRQKPWRVMGQAMEQWSQLPLWRRVWEQKQRREMESIGKVLWYGCLFRAGHKRLSEKKRNANGKIEIEIVKEEVLLEAQKWQAVSRGKCIRDCVDVHQKTIYGEPLEKVKDHIHTYRRLPWWRRWWHWREGRRIRGLEKLQLFLERYDAVKHTAIEQLERVRVVPQREGRIIMNHDKYELRGKVLILITELATCKKIIQQQHKDLTRRGPMLNWNEFLSEHRKEWQRFYPIHRKIDSFQQDLSENKILKKTQQELADALMAMQDLYSQQRIAYWQSCLEEKLGQAVSAHDVFCEAAEHRCLSEGRTAFDEVEQDYMEWIKGLPTQLTRVLEEVGIEPAEADQIRKQFQHWFEGNEQLKAQIIVDVSRWLSSCGQYALKRCRERKEIHEFERYEMWIAEKLQALGELKKEESAFLEKGANVFKKPDWFVDQHGLFVEQSGEVRRNYSIVLYRGTESLEVEWDRIFKSYLQPEWRRRVIEKVGTNFYLPRRKEGIEDNLEWLRKQYHRLALRYHSDHGSGEAGERCFQALQTWFTTQSEMLIKAVIPSPINIIWAQMAMGEDRSLDRQIKVDYQACLDQALIEQAQKKIEEWAQQERQKQVEKNEREIAEFNIWIKDRNERIDILNEDIGTLKEGFGTLNERIDILNEGIDILNEDIGTLKEGFGTLKEGFGTLNERLDTLNEDIGTLKEGFGTLEGLGTLNDILNEDIETLKLEMKQKFDAFQLEMDRRKEAEAQQKKSAEESKQGLARKVEQEKVVEKKPKHKEKKQGKANRNRFFSHQEKVSVAAAPIIHVMREQEHRKTAKCHVS